MKTTTNIFGFNFICNTSFDVLADEIIDNTDNSKNDITNLITPNANFINVYIKDKELNNYCKSSKYILPDGQPIVWLSYFTKNRIKQRLTGSDFFPVMFSKLKNEKFKCLFIVSNENLKTKFLEQKPDAYFYVPVFFNFEDKHIINEIGQSLAEIIVTNNINYVFIGISDPKQGALAENTYQKLKAFNYNGACTFFFLGASFEFYFELKKRAPKIFQKFGLEWFYRLLIEPKRMYKRYIFGNIIFVLRALNWLVNPKKYL